MDLPSRSLFLAIFLAVRFLQLFLPSVAEPSGDFISEICYDTRNIKLCDQILRSNPVPPGGYDLKVLWKKPLDELNAAAHSAYNLIGSLLKNQTDSRIRVHLDECLGDYKSTIGLIGESYKLLIARDYKYLRNKAVDIVDTEVKCERGFNETGLNEPIQLTKASNRFQDLGSIFVAVAKRLTWGRNYSTLKAM